jgi:hypothetical protein
LKVLVRHLELNRSGRSFAAESLAGLLKPERDQTILFYERGTRVEVEDQDTEAFVSQLKRLLDAEGGFTGQPNVVGASIRVFISYERSDIALAERVCDRLKQDNIDAWFDRERLAGGDLWEQRIQEEIQSRDFVLVLYSLNLCRKQIGYVNKELRMSVSRAEYYRDGRFLIPLRTEPIPDDDKVTILRPFDELELLPDAFEEDMRKIISQLKREAQRRVRAT